MIESVLLLGGGGVVVVAVTGACNILFRGFRRSRFTSFDCCCGLIRFTRDPLDGDEIIEDAKAAEIYPDDLDEIRDDLTQHLT